MSRTANRVLLLAIVLYTISLVLPALGTDSETYPGWMALVFGWMVFGDEPRWLANIFFFAGLVIFPLTRDRGSYLAAAPAGIAALMAVSCIVIPPAVAVGGDANPAMDTATLEIGAWCWILALGLLAWATLPRQAAQEAGHTATGTTGNTAIEVSGSLTAAEAAWACPNCRAWNPPASATCGKCDTPFSTDTPH